MAPIAFLSDRSTGEALPASISLDLDLKVEQLSVAVLGHVLALGPELVLVDAAENPGQAHAVLRAMRERDGIPPVVVIVERRDLERFAWDQIADELVFPGAPEAEIRVRLAMLRRRKGIHGDAVVRLGPLTLNVDTYEVQIQGVRLDLTYKEFELLRYLAERRGRVYTRPTLLREVWGYDFYGGTRTVDVHIRRLRAKLGPEFESLIETVRGVGYRAADL